MTGEVKRWGNSLALRIPKDLSRSLGLEEGSRVRLQIEDGKLVVIPGRGSRKQQLLKALEAYGRDPHGELEWGEDVGGERF